LIELRGVEARYGATLIGPITLNLKEGGAYALMGPSGSGKSTIARILAGYQVTESGSVFYQDTVQKIAGALFPGFAFATYVAAGEELHPFVLVKEVWQKSGKDTDSASLTKQIDELAKALHLSNLLGTKIGALSAGERQRVALGAALCSPRKKLLVLDEPFSHQDSALKTELQMLVLSHCKNANLSMLLVTHDLAEAMLMTKHLILLRRGKLIAKTTWNKALVSKKIALSALFHKLSLNGKYLAVELVETKSSTSGTQQLDTEVIKGQGLEMISSSTYNMYGPRIVEVQLEGIFVQPGGYLLYGYCLDSSETDKRVWYFSRERVVAQLGDILKIQIIRLKP
jgi:ABC-type multidrug transport system ATPase subunit